MRRRARTVALALSAAAAVALLALPATGVAAPSATSRAAQAGAAAHAGAAARAAHASITVLEPAYRETLKESPKQIRLFFDQRVKAFPASIKVLNTEGKVVSGPARSLPDERWMVADVPVLPKGPYTVRWYALSSDGHTVSGVYTFGVRFPAPPVTEAVGASGPTTTEHIVRGLYFIAFALLLGGLGFRLIVQRGRPMPAAYDRRVTWITLTGAISVVQLGIIAFCLRAEDALQLPFEKYVYGDLSPLSQHTRFGKAFVFMTLAYALVVALIFLSWLTGKLKPFLWPAFAISVAFVSGLSLSGHSAVDRGHWWGSQLADWVHLASGALWIGGLVMLVLAVWPTLPGERRAAFRAFSPYATGLVGLLVAAGIYLSILRLTRVSDLWDTRYGNVLIIKLCLVALALAWGGLHKFFVMRLLDRPQSDGVVARIRTSLLAESAVGMAVLIVAAVLVDSSPPQPPRPATTPAAAQSAATPSR